MTAEAEIKRQLWRLLQSVDRWRRHNKIHIWCRSSSAAPARERPPPREPSPDDPAGAKLIRKFGD